MTESSSRSPVYGGLLRKLEREITTGRYRTGQAMPTDEALAHQHGVSRYAAREVYTELVRRGLVRRVKRKGTVVIYDEKEVRPRKVGLILVADVPPFFIFEKGVEAVLGDHGTGLRVAYNYNHEPATLAAIDDAIAHDIQGLIVAPPSASSHERYRQLAAEGFPLVVAMTSCPGVHSVFPDDHKAGLLIGEHFAQQGFKRPAIVSDDFPYARVRMYGFREGLARHGLSLDDDRFVRLYYATEQGELLPDMGRRETEQLLALKPRPDAVLAVNEMSAIAIYYWLLKAGLRVPEDVAVAGIDHLGPRFHPFQITTVDIGLETMGRECASLLLKQMGDPDVATATLEIEPRLVVSASTRR